MRTAQSNPEAANSLSGYSTVLHIMPNISTDAVRAFVAATYTQEHAGHGYSSCLGPGCPLQQTASWQTRLDDTVYSTVKCARIRSCITHARRRLFIRRAQLSYRFSSTGTRHKIRIVSRQQLQYFHSTTSWFRDAVAVPGSIPQFQDADAHSPTLLGPSRPSTPSSFRLDESRFKVAAWTVVLLWAEHNFIFPFYRIKDQK